MVTGRDHGHSRPRQLGEAQEVDGIFIDRNAGLSHGGLKIRVFLVAHPIKGVPVGAVAGRSKRKTQPSRVQEIAHTFMAWLSIEVHSIILLEVEWSERSPPSSGELLEIIVKQ